MDIIENEIWKDIPNYEGFYQVSNYGKVKGLDRIIHRINGACQCYKSQILSPFHGKTSPYLQVALFKNRTSRKFLIHRLVAMCFLSDWDVAKEVNHIDGNKMNNMALNLEICTRQENINHSINLSLKNDYGECSSNAKLTNFDALRIRNLHKWGIRQVDLARMYNLSKQTICSIVHNKTYFK